MQKVQAAPVAKKLMRGLRDLGYDFEAAVADLVDNSLEADATQVDVEIIPRRGNVPAHVVIADNGNGIENERLVDVMRLGAAEEHRPDELGKYGMGLKTASLSQADVLTVATRAASKGRRGKAHMARWDLNTLDVKWDLQLLDDDDLATWEHKALQANVAREQGTVVLWSSLRADLLLDAKVETRRENALADLIERVSRHLREVFHRFLQNLIPRRRKVEIRVAGTPLIAADPFCRTEAATKELKVEEYEIDSVDGRKGKLTVAPCILPTAERFSSKAAFEAAGWGNWNQRQGLYFYRNNRLIQAGGWSWLRAADEHTKYLRVAIDFSGDLDDAVGINVAKMRARIPAQVRDTVRNASSVWAKKARESYDKGRDPDDDKLAQKSGGRTARRAESRAAKKPEEASRLHFGAMVIVPTIDDATGVTAPRPGKLRVELPTNSGTFDLQPMEAFATALVELIAAVAEGSIPARSLPVKSLRRALKELL